MSAKPRRTQAERREAMIARLIDGTIEALASSGYRGSTVQQICDCAEVSQGALFRHFGTRLDIIVAATEEIARRHIARFRGTFFEPVGRDAIEGLVEFIRAAARTAEHAAWHEVMVAARTDDELRASVAEPLQRFETALLELVGTTLGIEGAAAERLGVVFLSVLHMFDSEAVTVGVYANPPLERARVRWAVELLESELEVAMQ